MAASDEMACNELVEVITEYLEGTLPEPDRTRFERHLAECPYCRTYVEQMRQTIAAVGSLREDAVAPEDREQILELFRTWRQ